jgi:HlyD family secretion protein
MNIETRIGREDATPVYFDEGGGEEARKKRRLMIGIAALIAAALIAWFLFGRGGGEDAAAPKAKQAPSVTVFVPGRQSVASTISATGSLAARREMPVGVVGEGGMVTRVWVEPGDWVGAGQVLASIERSVQTQETAQLAANISVAQADAKLAQAELDRAQALLARGFISKADIDRRTATRDAAVARVRVAQAQLGAGRARVGRLDIRAPAAGLVLSRAVEPGQVVSPGSGVLFRLARGGEMEMRAQLAEGDLARLSVGLGAQVTPVGTANSFTGQIWQMPPVIDPQTRQGVVRVALAYNPALRPGGFASATIASGRVDAPLLPESAVLTDAKGSFVYVIDGNNKAVRRDVKPGPITDAGIPILSGLTGTERVVLSAGAFLNPGETVVPVKSTPAR